MSVIIALLEQAPSPQEGLSKVDIADSDTPEQKDAKIRAEFEDITKVLSSFPGVDTGVGMPPM
jgi:peroxiredoxin